MDIKLQQTIRLDYLSDPRLQERKIRLALLRLDLIHPLISGNKWFKLKENLKLAIAEKAASVLTFGGAYSNHLIATAAATKAAGLHSIGVVRGWHGAAQENPTLEACRALDMQLKFISREEYREKDSAAFQERIGREFPRSFVIPEGGNNAAGISGAAEIASYLPAEASHVALAVGTGTTMAGMALALPQKVPLLGFCALKNGEYLKNKLHQLIDHPYWELFTDAHEGGFAKHNTALISWMNLFYEQQQIPLDFVYTAKMMKRMFTLIESDYFPSGSHIICIHTGGLQGNSSIAQHLCYS